MMMMMMKRTYISYRYIVFIYSVSVSCLARVAAGRDVIKGSGGARRFDLVMRGQLATTPAHNTHHHSTITAHHITNTASLKALTNYKRNEYNEQRTNQVQSIRFSLNYLFNIFWLCYVTLRLCLLSCEYFVWFGFGVQITFLGFKKNIL